MNMNAEPYAELSELIIRQMEGSLDQAAFLRLDEILADNDEAQNYYLDFLEICGGLRQGGVVIEPKKEPSSSDTVFWEIVDKDLATLEEKETAQRLQARAEAHRTTGSVELKAAQAHLKGGPRRVENYLQLAAIAAMMLLVVIIIWNSRQPISTEVVARITGEENAQWAKAEQPLGVGEDLLAQSLSLRSGLAEITFCNGARVILEAPVDVTLNKTEEIYLKKGKISVTASGGAVGFAVVTDVTRVVDLGTEFGVNATAAGQTDVQVFQGEVALMPGWQKNSFNANSQPRINLAKGQARRVFADYSVKPLSHNTMAFVRQEEFQARQQAQAGNAYGRWRAWSYQLRRDPDLVAYYTFEKDDARPLSLINCAAATQGGLDGRLENIGPTDVFPAWIEGRWPEKTALKFERESNHQVAVAADPAFCLAGDVTITAWICCPDPVKGGHILSNRRFSDVNYWLSWLTEGKPLQANRPNKLEFNRCDKARVTGSCASAQPEMLGEEWIFLAVSHDNSQVCFYVNGELTEIRDYPSTLDAPVKADLVIGAMPTDYEGAGRMGRFNGIIDEIAIFKRILASQDVRSMYEIGNPGR